MPARRGAPTSKLVVVIDDDRMTLDAMDGLLRSWGYRVVTAVSDDEALARLAGQRPDLIICDYQLGEGKIGIEVIERLRDNFDIPALLITGDRAVHTKEVRAKRYRLLFKPLDPTLLEATLNQLFPGKPREE
jgi:CheY-like chemotaxis protein